MLTNVYVFELPVSKMKLSLFIPCTCIDFIIFTCLRGKLIEKHSLECQSGHSRGKNDFFDTLLPYRNVFYCSDLFHKLMSSSTLTHNNQIHQFEKKISISIIRIIAVNIF